jgi:hypothetical protein
VPGARAHGDYGWLHRKDASSEPVTQSDPRDHRAPSSELDGVAGSSTPVAWPTSMRWPSGSRR